MRGQEGVKKRETVVPSKKTRGNQHKLTDRIINLNINKKTFL